jgi:hypothetical protein
MDALPAQHIKDGLFNGGPAFGWTMTDVGDGDVPFEPFFCGRDTATDQVANPAGSFSTTERSYADLAGLRERCGGKSGLRDELGVPPLGPGSKSFGGCAANACAVPDQGRRGTPMRDDDVRSGRRRGPVPMKSPPANRRRRRSERTRRRRSREADDGPRTRDLWLGKPTLYQLSYVRVGVDCSPQPTCCPRRPRRARRAALRF